jgi:hypothetical protein
MKRFFYLLILFFAPTTLVAQDWNIIWQQCFGGSQPDGAYDIIAIENGYFTVGGTGSSDGDISFSYGMGDGWLVRTDSTGNLLWEKTYGGSDSEGFRRILPSTDGNYYLIGTSWSTDGDITYNPYPGTGSFWVVKIDIEGNILWDKILGGTKGDRPWTGAATADGGVVAIGEVSSDDGHVSVHYGGNDTWLVKLSADGEVEWDYTIGTGWFDIGQAIIQTSGGGYLAGSNSIILQGAVGNITCIPPSYGYVTGVLTKFDADMNVQWQRCYGGNNHDAIVGILELDDGYIFSGSTESTNIPGHKGNGDVWVVRIDFDGNIVWQKAFGGSIGEAGNKIFQTDDNGFIVAGNTYSNNGDVSGNHSMSEHYPDIWMFKINSVGELQWQQCFGGGGREEISRGVVRKSDNNFVIAATTNLGPSYDVGCAPYGGVWDKDFWVFEILKDDTVNIVTAQVEAEKVRVYPNPAKDYVQFEVHSSKFPARLRQQAGKFEVGELRLFDVFGREVARKDITSEQTVLDVSVLPGGVYFYRVALEEISYSGKIVIQK